MTFERLFLYAMKRQLPELISEVSPIELPMGLRFSVGDPGQMMPVDGSRCLSPPEWRFPEHNIPAGFESVSLIHAYHFLEHLSGEDAIRFLIEAERVLVPGGVLQFCIPWAKSAIAFQDLTHKSFWTEDSFSILFSNGHYDPSGSRHEWKLRVHYLVICGIVERNMVLIGQLKKRTDFDSLIYPEAKR